MTKRILAMLLASLILITSFPVHARAAEGTGYRVDLASDCQDKLLGIGDMATVTVTVAGNGETEAYSAYDLKLSYDPDHLTLVSAAAADSDAQVTDAEGRIRVKGYGGEKTFQTAAVTLTFQAKLPGTAEVTVTHAKIDISENAGAQNAPEAALGDKSVQIRIDGYEVITVGEGIGVTSHVATDKADFIFWLNDIQNYDYTVNVTVGGADVTGKVSCDQKTGTYRIPKEEIRGTVVITAERTPKTYRVTIQGKGVTGEKTAEYNKDYVFSLDREEGKLYTVVITVGGQEYDGYRLEEDVYTIPGTDITGDIVIKVTEEKDDSNQVTVTFAGTGAKDGSGQKKTDREVEYPFKIKRKKGYTYSVAVYVEGKRVPYDYDYELDTYYILPQYVTGNITVVIGKVATLEVTEYITLDKASIFLILYNGIVNEGQVPKYDGRSMFWSDRYKAYAWLVTSADTDKKVKKSAEAKITVNEGAAAASVDYSGNVNMTLQADLADARLVREMYEGRHSLDFTDMQQLLNADVCSDKKLNVRDAAAIVKTIS